MAVADTPEAQRLAPARVWPGLALALGAGAVTLGVATLLPSVSALLVAILLGVLVANVVTLPPLVRPGLTVASKSLLRAGIVLLGLRISLGEILQLGWQVVLLAALVVLTGMLAAWHLGGLLRLRPTQRLLIGAGFSICGAAAVAAVEAGLETKEGDEDSAEDVVTALALVVLFGTLMIPLVPLAAAALGLDEHVAGVWAGVSIHEVAQVVAAGGIIGASALQVAVVVKLIRVLMLAPVIVTINLLRRRGATVTGSGSAPPLVPTFILGFVAVVLVRTFVPLPSAVLSVGHLAETVLLSTAMFALGCGVHRGVLRNIRGGKVGLAAAVTLCVAGVGLLGAQLVG